MVLTSLRQWIHQKSFTARRRRQGATGTITPWCEKRSTASLPLFIRGGWPVTASWCSIGGGTAFMPRPYSFGPFTPSQAPSVVDYGAQYSGWANPYAEE
jgi:hypothetical protein